MATDNEMKYYVTYTIRRHREGLSKEQALSLNKVYDCGASTAVLVGSLLYPLDGSYSALFASMDGRTGEPLDGNELWKAWSMLTHQLAEDASVPPEKRKLCQSVFDIIRKAMLATTRSDTNSEENEEEELG